MLTLAAMLLAACIFSALGVLFVRRRGAPPSAADYLRLVDNVVGEGPRELGDLGTLTRSHIRMWTESAADVRKVVESKRFYLGLAHSLLAAAIALAVLAAVARIWRSAF